MTHSNTRLYILAAAVFTTLTLQAGAEANSCEQLAKLTLPNTTITKAELFTGGTLTPENGFPAIHDLPSFCRVVATLTPSKDSDIKVEVWLPLASDWNGRYVGTGNGGFAGKLVYWALPYELRKGYATANTDMGTAIPQGKDQSIFINRPERWADWGYRSTHEMTVLAKQLVRIYYAQEAKHSYFEGCSTGGEEALMEAQRYPDDYEGIVAGAPANNRTALHMNILWNYAVMEHSAESWLSAQKVNLLFNAVLDACDAKDGVKDGLVSDPERCKFDPAVLVCKAEDKPDCLTRAQIETVKKIYSGPVNPRTGAQIYPGLTVGSEYDWSKIAAVYTPNGKAPFAPLFQWVLGTDWDWHNFDFDHDADAVNKKLSGVLNATNPNLDIFRAHGHKLIAYHGWSDRLVPPQESINYYNAVVAEEKSIHPSINVGDFYRLFMLPGVQHCSGGAGPDSIDSLGAIVNWVEQGIAPDQLIARRKPDAAGKSMTRPLCPYPQIAMYDGTGDTNDATSFQCALPETLPRKK